MPTMKKLLARLSRSTRTALIVGVVLAIASIPLPTLLALAVGLLAAGALGYGFPDEAIKVGVMVALPILLVAFLVGLIRGFDAIVLVVFLVCSLVLPVALARLGAGARVGRPSS